MSLATGELRAIRDASKVAGGRDGLVTRARHHLQLEAIDSARLEANDSRLAALETLLETRLASIETRLTALEGAHVGLVEPGLANLAGVGRQVEGAFETLRSFEAATQVHFAEVERRLRRSDRLARVEAVTAWIRAADLPIATPISIVLATRNRSGLVGRAVESVSAQVYPCWELIIVDDGSSDDTPELLAKLASEDERIVVVSQPHRGVSAARNAGLVAATGDVICYLDDDNLMEPLWLKSVAWAFSRHPDHHFLYGARVMDVESSEGPAGDSLPTFQFDPFDRRRLEAENYIDLGVMAHRRSHPEARFDEELAAVVDWDLVLRMTAERAPLELPVVASVYTTSAPNRISRSGRDHAANLTLARRLRRVSPLRVLAYNSLYPLVQETYIPDEMKALTDNGAELAWCTDQWSPSPVTVAEPLFTDLDAAVAAFAPDVLFVYWAGFAAASLEKLSAVQVPFALRVHSFDFDPSTIEAVQSHPLCVGVWAYPHHAQRLAGAHELVPLVTTWDDFPPPAAERTIVLAHTAGVPKRNWPLLVASLAALARSGVDCRIAIGVTHALEEEPDRVRELIRESGAPVKLSVDVPHDQVIALLARTAVTVYTLDSEGRFGMPRSVIEGMCAGTSVILPARPEASLVAGPDCRTYVRSEDIIRHATEILAGGPAIEAERRANRELARSKYADPALAATFHSQLARAVTWWRDR